LCFAWIASLLEQNGISVKVLDFHIEDIDLSKFLQNEKLLCVGVSGTTQSRFSSFKIAEEVKNINSEIMTIYGGPHATPTAEDTLNHVSAIDAVVRNEGEITVLEIMQSLKKSCKVDLSKILGTSYREKEHIVHNPVRPFLKDLDELPLPAWHLFKMDRYKQELECLNLSGHVILTSRGCPYKCSFCSARLLWNCHYSKRSAGSVVDELEHLVDRYSIEGFKIFDSTFTINRHHVISICDEINKRGFDYLRWECEIRADTVDKELLQTMKAAGCYYVDMGLESASSRVRKAISKGISLKQVKNVINWCNELDLLVKLFITWGHPTETYKEALETYKFLEKYQDRVYRMASHVGIMIYPGTDVEKFARQQGYLSPDFSWSNPYCEVANLNLGSDPEVPLLIQPQMKYKHLARINFKLNWKPLLNLSNIFRKLSELFFKKDLRKKHINTLIELFNQRFNRNIQTLERNAS
jgi:magnesium-protoporphyrin IX monomethyl ester (oxidative) cyclase